jgi:hypothetical protein
MEPRVKRRRLDKLTLFADVGYAPHPGQMLVHNSTERRRVLACGVRWGKTLCAAMEAFVALLKPSKSTIGWTVAPTLELSELVFSRVVAVMQRHFKHRIKEINARERRLVVVNFGGGLSELRGKSADAPDSLLGEGLDFVIVDEAARMRPEIWQEHLSQRLIDKRGWALLISTPGDRGWFWKEFRRGLKHRDAMYQSWSSPSWTNPHLNRELIEEECKRLGGDTFKSQYGGEFLGFDPGPCELCGCPDGSLLAIYCGPDDSPLDTCADCGWPIDRAGHTVIQGFDERGQPRQRIRIIFEERLDGTASHATHCVNGVECYAGTRTPVGQPFPAEPMQTEAERPDGAMEIDV